MSWPSRRAPAAAPSRDLSLGQGPCCRSVLDGEIVAFKRLKGVPQKWMVFGRENPNLKWMMTGGTSIYRNLLVVIDGDIQKNQNENMDLKIENDGDIGTYAVECSFDEECIEQST